MRNLQLVLGFILAFAAATAPASTASGGAEQSKFTLIENFADILFFDDFNTDDCRPYDLQPKMTAPGGNWTQPENVQFQSFTVPASQRGGGIIDATLSSGDVGEIKPRLFACIDQACSGGSIVGDTNTSSNPARVRFQAEAGQTYQFRIEQFGNAPVDDYPITYSMTIDYSDRLDCWEPNDQIAESRLIQPGESVFAYMIEGFTENALTTGTYADWYRFTLDQAAIIRINIVQVAGNHKMNVKVYENPDESGSVLMDPASQPDIGESFTTQSTRARDPGVYFVRVGLSLQDDNKVSGEDVSPGHWMDEYEMIISSVAP